VRTKLVPFVSHQAYKKGSVVVVHGRIEGGTQRVLQLLCGQGHFLYV